MEQPIAVSFGSFRKVYCIDLLVENGALYELKAASAICAEHRTQALNYLLLAGLHHGKLINFAPHRVGHEFVSTQLTPEKRSAFACKMENWNEIDKDSRDLRQIVDALATDWGTFLDVELYTEAVVHFRGGDQSVVQPIDLTYRSRPLGKHKMHLLNPTTAFKITTFTGQIAANERSLRRLLALTPLRQIQWVNFHHHEIAFRTILRDP